MQSSRPVFYQYLNEGPSLDTYINEQVRTRLTGRRTQLLDERNVHTYRHGDRWSVKTSEDDPTTMRSMSAESVIHTIDVINHSTEIIERHIESMVQQLYAGLMKNLFETVGEVAESVGNTVGLKDHDGNIPAGFLAMIKKIEFGVDRYGSAQRPSLHASREIGQKILSALEEQPDQFRLEVEQITLGKEKKAVAAEAYRIARFRWNPS